MGQLATDHPKQATFRKRMLAAKRRGDVYMATTQPILVPFKKDFDSFAAEVAHQFRRHIVYRTDGGRFARGLVRASGDLKLIHEAYVALGQRENDKIRLVAVLFRRKDTTPEDRWVMSMRFSAPDWYDAEPDIIAPSDQTIAKIWKQGLNDFIDKALIISSEIHGEQGKRIKRLLEFADKLPYEKAINLWYFEPFMIIQYLDSSDNERKEMLRDAGGAAPSDADRDTYTIPRDDFIPPKNWARYPFRSWQRYTQRIDFWSAEQIKKSLLETDEDIKRSLWEFERVKLSGNARRTETDLYTVFRDYLRGLQNNKNHLYSIYK